MLSWRRSFFIILGLVVLSFSAFADEEVVTQGVEKTEEIFPGKTGDVYRQELGRLVTKQEPEEEFNNQVDAFVRYVPASDAGGQSGDISIIQSDIEYSYEYKAFDKLPVKFSLINGYLGVDNSTVVELPARLTTFAVDAETTLPFFSFEKTYLRLGITPSYYDDGWHFEDSAFRFLGRAVLIAQPNDELTLVLGVGGYPDFVSKIVPIAGFIYKPNDKLVFNIIPRRPNISYAVNEKLTLFTEVGFNFDEYEVEKEGQKNVSLEYKEIHSGAGAKYKFNKNITGNISVGGMFQRMLRYRDSLGKVKVKPGFYSEFRLQARI